MNDYQRQIMENQVALMRLLLPAETDKEITESVNQCKEAFEKSQKMLNKDTQYRKTGVPL